MKIGIVGGSGYSGAELLRYIAGHPTLEATVATSREFSGQRVDSVYPNIPLDLSYTDLDLDELGSLDLVFLALPHGASMEIGTTLAERGTMVVDFSADFRLKDAAAYPEWFGREHSAKDSLASWVYGLPELHRDQLRGANLVANPGCYPTATLLALAPLVGSGLIETDGIVVSAASGVSGAGRGVNAGVHFSHVDANFKAYGFPGHKHTPEMEQELSLLAGALIRITFIPHLVPMARGLLATCIAPARAGVSPQDLLDAAHARYDAEPFVKVVSSAPESKHTAASNMCLVSYSLDQRTGRVVAVAALDNLGKGAAGQALQNANLMLGLPESDGLTTGGVYP